MLKIEISKVFSGSLIYIENISLHICTMRQLPNETHRDLSPDRRDGEVGHFYP